MLSITDQINNMQDHLLVSVLKYYSNVKSFDPSQPLGTSRSHSCFIFYKSEFSYVFYTNVKKVYYS